MPPWRRLGTGPGKRLGRSEGRAGCASARPAPVPGDGPAQAARHAAASASALIGAKIRGILRSRRGFMRPESTELLDEMLMAKLRRVPSGFAWPAARKRGQISALA